MSANRPRPSALHARVETTFSARIAQPEQNDHFERQNNCQRPESQRGQQIDGGGRGGNRQQRGDNSPRTRGKLRRSFGPVFERARIEAHFQIFAEQREFLAQIEFVAEFDDDFVSFADGRHGDAAVSHCARRSSPIGRSAVESSSKRQPVPKMSRSSAYTCLGLRKRSPDAPVPDQRSSRRAMPRW